MLLHLINGCLPKEANYESLGLKAATRKAYNRALETKLETLWFFAKECDLPEAEDFVLEEVIKIETELNKDSLS